jgi:citrate synthase
MTGPEMLESHAGVLRTRVGACWPGTRAVFRGHDLHEDLRNSDWLELYLFGITGRRFTPQETRLLHGIWVMTSYPDARIWNNRVAGLAGSARSTPILGLTGAQAVTEARVYAGGPGLRAIDFYLRAGKAVASGQDLKDVVLRELESSYIYGFGRPINSRDERLPWLMDLARSLGLAEGRHLQLAFEVERILVEDIGKTALQMNYAGLTAALGADLGLTPRQWHIFRFPIVLAGMPPCWLEAAEKPEGALFPIPCDGIDYEGLPERPWIR